MEGQSGTIVPSEDEPFPPSDAGAVIIEGGISWRYRKVTGGAENGWGVGFGFDFKDEPGLSPTALCDAGWCTGTLPEAGNADYRSDHCSDAGTFNSHVALIDESSHLGISFWAKGSWTIDAGPFALEVLVSDKSTTPVAGDISCSACSLNPGPHTCPADFAKKVFLTENWQQHVVFFSELQQPSGMGIDRTTLGHLNFEVQTGDNGLPLPGFTVQIAHVEWADWVSDD
jgi:hypothetical protein